MQTFSADDEGMLGDVGLPTQGSLRMPGPSYEAAKLVRKLLQVDGCLLSNHKCRID